MALPSANAPLGVGPLVNMRARASELADPSKPDFSARDSHGPSCGRTCSPDSSRSSSPRGAENSGSGVVPSESSTGKRPSLVGRVVRSVSFGRKAKKKASESVAAGKSALTEDPVPFRNPAPFKTDLTHAQGIESGYVSSRYVLHGFLDKRKQEEKKVTRYLKDQRAQWVTRYFVVDDQLGTLRYQKKEYSNAGPAADAKVVISLADIVAVAAITGDAVGNYPHCFRVSCPSIQLTLRAEDREDCILWVRGLEKRMAIWRQAGGSRGGGAGESSPQSGSGHHSNSSDSSVPTAPTVAATVISHPIQSIPVATAVSADQARSPGLTKSCDLVKSSPLAHLSETRATKLDERLDNSRSVGQASLGRSEPKSCASPVLQDCDY